VNVDALTPAASISACTSDRILIAQPINASLVPPTRRLPIRLVCAIAAFPETRG
jgi:hypothetical protein